jgi:nucleotide-binding universal stress UspA family protein
MFHHIVVGVDETASARRAAAWTAHVAAGDGAEVTAVHVLTPDAELAADLPPVGMTNWRTVLRRRIDESWATPLRESHVRYHCQIVEADSVAAGIARVAATAGADLVVVGATRHRGWSDRLFGSVGVQIAQHEDYPVVVVPARWALAGQEEHRARAGLSGSP